MGRRRSAVTLTEILIFGGLGIGLLGLCFHLFLSGTERTVKVTRAQQDLLSMETTWEHLLRDLRQAVPARAHDAELADALASSKDVPEITFLVASRVGPPRRVRYAFDESTGQLARDGDPIQSSRFARVTFTHRVEEGVPYLDVRFVLPDGTPEAAKERVLTRVLAPPLADDRFGWSARLSPHS